MPVLERMLALVLALMPVAIAMRCRCPSPCYGTNHAELLHPDDCSLLCPSHARSLRLWQTLAACAVTYVIRAVCAK